MEANQKKNDLTYCIFEGLDMPEGFAFTENEYMYEYDNVSDDGSVVDETAQAEEKKYKDSTYEVVSKIAYLIGVPKHIFANEHEPPKQEIYDLLNADKNARIIRNLCIVRTAIERNFKNISEKMRFDYASIMNMPEYIPQQSITELSFDGINFTRRTNTKLFQYIIEINKIISDKINNCKKFFPLWLKWSYIRDLFIMPDGLKESGAKAAAETYYSGKAYYPYKMYINWRPKSAGNILFNDKKFITVLYEQHNDFFTEYNKVSDAGSYIKGSIYDFIGSSEKVVVLVDCENSDPYKLCATLKNLDHEHTKKISSIILVDDVNTVETWQVLESFTSIPVEHMMTERVKQDKSLVDVMLISRTCLEHYRNNVDSFILVSSDSDYWGMISSLPDARFLVMIERAHCGPDLKKALTGAGVFYCYIDDFYSGNAEDIKLGAIFKELNRYIEKTVRLNINDMLNEALRSARVEMGTEERKRFIAQYIRPMRMSINDTGDMVLELKRWK